MKNINKNLIFFIVIIFVFGFFFANNAFAWEGMYPNSIPVGIMSTGNYNSGYNGNVNGYNNNWNGNNYPPVSPAPTYTNTNTTPSTTSNTVSKTTKTTTVAKNTKTGTTVASTKNTSTNENSLAANAIFGAGSFIPGSFLQWLIVFILVLLIVFLWRKIYVSDKDRAIPLKHA